MKYNILGCIGTLAPLVLLPTVAYACIGGPGSTETFWGDMFPHELLTTLVQRGFDPGLVIFMICVFLCVLALTWGGLCFSLYLTVKSIRSLRKTSGSPQLLRPVVRSVAYLLFSAVATYNTFIPIALQGRNIFCETLELGLVLVTFISWTCTFFFYKQLHKICRTAFFASVALVFASAIYFETISMLTSSFCVSSSSTLPETISNY